MARHFAFKNRNPEFDGEFTGEHDQVVGSIDPGTQRELGALTVEYDGVHLSWFNQQEEPSVGTLETGQTIEFRSGERLAFYDLPEDAQAALDGWLAEDLQVASDLGLD